MDGAAAAILSGNSGMRLSDIACRWAFSPGKTGQSRFGRPDCGPRMPTNDSDRLLLHAKEAPPRAKADNPKPHCRSFPNEQANQLG
jgi:hypothetical protein